MINTVPISDLLDGVDVAFTPAHLLCAEIMTVIVAAGLVDDLLEPAKRLADNLCRPVLQTTLTGDFLRALHTHAPSNESLALRNRLYC